MFLYANMDTQREEFHKLVKDIKQTTELLKNGCRWEYSASKKYHIFNYACAEYEKDHKQPPFLFSIEHKKIRSYKISKKVLVVQGERYRRYGLEKNKKILINSIILHNDYAENYGGLKKLDYFKLYLLGEEVILPEIELDKMLMAGDINQEKRPSSSSPSNFSEERQMQKPLFSDIEKMPNANKNLSSVSFYLKSTSRLVLPITLFKDREFKNFFSEKAKPYFSIAYYTVPSDPYIHYPISVVFPVKYKDNKVYIVFTKEKSDKSFSNVVVHMPKEGMAATELQKKIEQCISKSLYDTQSKTIFEQCGVTPWSGARWVEF